jgi:hypothetical protein
MQQALASRLEHAKAESIEAEEARLRARRELGGLHTAWHRQLDDLKQENQ